MDSFEELGINNLTYNIDDYDLDGLIRLADGEAASMVFMYFDEDDHCYYRNRYEILECERGINHILAHVERYLDKEELNGLFIAFAAVYEGRLNLLGGKRIAVNQVDMGEMELGENLVYGLMIHKEEEGYVFDELLYHDGGSESASWTSSIEETGQLGRQLKKLINRYA